MRLGLMHDVLQRTQQATNTFPLQATWFASNHSACSKYEQNNQQMK